jgi:tRNA A-37 threonylcarbamoyl transferase component Bud32
MNIDNAIEAQYRQLTDHLNNEYERLYDAIDHEKLKILFSTLHNRLVSLFDTMNQRLPTTLEDSAHFLADPSRALIKTIEIIESLQKSLERSKYAFTVDEYYSKIISQCKKFLNKSGGSSIPPGMAKIGLYYTIPIFLSQDSIIIENPEVKYVSLELIGEGSYAQVFRYFDNFYQKDYVLKRAKKDLNDKEIERFKREYEEMKKLKSPYIVEVFGYIEKKKEYIMESMDISLYKYIMYNNTKLSFPDRKKIINQIIKAFSYIHSKQLLHRDISPNNILLKLYDDVIVVKISDFGLVKLPESNLTSANTELKGYFNDPNLSVEGFDKYEIVHETYALTRLLYFVMTGKTTTGKVKNSNLKDFICKGLNSNKDQRFKNIDELSQAFQGVTTDQS